jgi:hypothetical protein
LYSSPNIWRRNTYREDRNSYSDLVGKPEEKTPLGRSTRKWEDNIKMNLREIKWSAIDRINRVEHRD